MALLSMNNENEIFLILENSGKGRVIWYKVTGKEVMKWDIESFYFTTIESTLFNSMLVLNKTEQFTNDKQ